MEHLRVSPSLEHRPPSSGNPRTLAPGARLRAACDPCHQAKVRCSGDSPCSTCRTSSLRCTYSAASRQGRPKGSKNKRTIMQEKKAKSNLELERRQEAVFSYHRGDNIRKDTQEWPQPHGSTFPDLDFTHDLEHIGASNNYLDEASGILLGPQEESTGLDINSDACFGAGLDNAPDEQCSSRAPSASLEEMSMSGQVSACSGRVIVEVADVCGVFKGLGSTLPIIKCHLSKYAGYDATP